MTFDYDATRLDMVPEHLREGLQAHIETGRPTGSGLGSILINGPVGDVVAHLDDRALAGLRGTIQFLYNYAPCQCWGSAERVAAWRARGGIEGRAGR